MKQNHRTEFTDENQLSYEQQQIEENIKINGYCCFSCGIKYLTEKQKSKRGVSTFHKSICCVCGKDSPVTHIRAYNWLIMPKGIPNDHGDDNFSILEDKEHLKL